MSIIADLFAKYNCTNCQEEISGIRVHCAECENFDLCLQCFALGAEIGAHQNNHAYQFMDTGTSILSVFRSKGAWTAKEEVRLLDALEQYGFGNWEDISKHIETKSPEDAKEEYISKFVNGTIGRHAWASARDQRPTLVDHTSEDSGPLGAAALQRLPPLDITEEEATQLGYMPNRDSFEREYDPTAEQLVSSISLNAEDIEADYLLKLAQIDMYTRRLRERVRRKRIVRDYQLVSNFFRNKNYALHTGLTKEQKEFRDRFRVFAQFYSSEEYERLVASLDREKDLRIRLAELCRYRYNGLTKIAECCHFEQHAAMASHRSTGPYGHGKTDNTHLNPGSRRPHASSSHSPPHQSRKSEISRENEANSSSIVPKSMHHTGGPISSAALSHSKNYSDSYRYQASSAPTMMPIAPATPSPPTTTIITAIPATAAMTTSTAMTTTSPTMMMASVKSESPDLQQPQQQQQPLIHATTLYPPPLYQFQHPVKGLAKLGPSSDAVGVANPPAGAANVQLGVIKQQQQQQQAQQQQQHSMLQLQEGNNNNVECPMPKSSILQAQLNELKHLTQPLGSTMLSHNEQQLCKIMNLPPTTYLSIKAVMLSGGASSTTLTPIENSLRKYFIKAGWLSH